MCRLKAVSVALTSTVLLSWCVLHGAAAETKPAARESEAPEKRRLSYDEDVLRLAARIDELIADRWTEEDVVPAKPADDAEFLRRVSLDIAGKIPHASKVRKFLNDNSADKRERAVLRLLAGRGYANNFTNFWRRVMLPEADTNVQARYMIPGFEAWLRDRLQKNTRYDELVRQILTTPLDGSRNIYSYRQGELTPIAFYQAKETKPENLGAATSRIFLGIRLECAQCHNHPFDDWQREEFWRFAAFYSSLERDRSESGLLGAIREILGGDRSRPKGLRIPETDTYVEAAFLDGTRPEDKTPSREMLADWITSPENPYFARTAANRIWAHFFGIGLVQPVDDFGDGNPASHPVLLDELARGLAARRFDLKFLMCAITASRTYQLSSAVSHESQTRNPRLFARMPVKGLTAEQLFDSLAVATGYHRPDENSNPFAFRADTPRSRFIELFENTADSSTERQTTILQSLAMMNGEIVGNATSLQQSRTLSAVTDYPLMTTRERIETLYLATLSRRPRPDELSRLVDYVESAGKKPRQDRALSDVFWALLNSSEFTLNH